MTDVRDGYTPILNTLLPLYPTLLSSRNARFAGTLQRAGYLANGWFLRCQRSVDCLLVLDQAGYVEEASPIRRCIVEHVLALKWLAVEGNSVVDTVAEGHAKNARDKIKALSDAGWTSVDIADLQQIVTEIEGMPHDVSKSHLLHYAQRREQYGDAHDLPIYLTEVAKTHPSYESAVAYCSIEDGTLKMLPGPRVRDWSQIPFATTQLLDALLAVRHAFEPMPWADTLQAVLDDYRQVTDVVRKQDGLQPVNWDDDGYATV